MPRAGRHPVTGGRVRVQSLVWSTGTTRRAVPAPRRPWGRGTSEGTDSAQPAAPRSSDTGSPRPAEADDSGDSGDGPGTFAATPDTSVRDRRGSASAVADAAAATALASPNTSN